VTHPSALKQGFTVVVCTYLLTQLPTAFITLDEFHIAHYVSVIKLPLAIVAATLRDDGVHLLVRLFICRLKRVYRVGQKTGLFLRSHNFATTDDINL